MRTSKLTNEKSFVAAKATEKRQQTEVFNQKVAKLEESPELMKQVVEKGGQYINFIKDKTLKINKGPIVIQAENNLLVQMASMAEQLNQMENQPEGAGSSALCSILMKSILILRDRINELAYEQEERRKADRLTQPG